MQTMTQKADSKQLRSFALIVGGIFGLIGVWPLVFGKRTPAWWAIALAGALVVPGLVQPRLLGPVYRVWMALGHALGWFNTRVILGIIFYLVVTPMALVRRLLGKDSMRRDFEPGLDTYRAAKKTRPPRHMDRQF